MKIAWCLFVIVSIYAVELCTASPTGVAPVNTAREETNLSIEVITNSNNGIDTGITDSELAADLKKVKKLCKRACRKKKGGKFKLGKCGRRKRYKWICVFCRTVYRCGRPKMGTNLHP